MFICRVVEINIKRSCIKKHKVRTDRNSLIGPNEVVRVATLLLKYLYTGDKRTAKWKAPFHPTFPGVEADLKRKPYHVV